MAVKMEIRKLVMMELLGLQARVRGTERKKHLNLLTKSKLQPIMGHLGSQSLLINPFSLQKTKINISKVCLICLHKNT
jgi:hypothetical protein